jgi:threonine synthase
MTRNFIQKYKGETLTISDEEILNASKLLAGNTGLFAEPAAAAAFAGFLSYRKNDRIPADSLNVVLLTGGGLKDLRSVSSLLKMPSSIYPSIDNLMRVLQ